MCPPSAVKLAGVSNRQRIVLLAVAAVVLVAGLALAAAGGGDDDAGSETAATPTIAPPGEAGGSTTSEEAPEATPAPPRVESIRIRGGGPVGEPRTLRFQRGDTIRLRFTSDAASEVHIHGFDREVQVPAGGRPRTVRFEADLEGIFEIEAHETGEQLAKLQVRPR